MGLIIKGTIPRGPQHFPYDPRIHLQPYGLLNWGLPGPRSFVTTLGAKNGDFSKNTNQGGSLLAFLAYPLRKKKILINSIH